MTTHIAHPKPDERSEFLVDGCPRCAEYVEHEGIDFDDDRFRAFWAKMVEVEYDDKGSYVSDLDKRLGRRLYYLSLSLHRAFGLDPRALSDHATYAAGTNNAMNAKRLAQVLIYAWQGRNVWDSPTDVHYVYRCHRAALGLPPVAATG